MLCRENGTSIAIIQLCFIMWSIRISYSGAALFSFFLCAVFSCCFMRRQDKCICKRDNDDFEGSCDESTSHVLIQHTSGKWASLV